MLDFINEILETLRQNKLRAMMTGFSIAWGIFMLIVLLGAGNGLKHGMEKGFSGSSNNALWINPGTTQKAFDGIREGKPIEFQNEDCDALKLLYPEIVNISGRYEIRLQASYNQEYGNFQIEGVTPKFNNIVFVNQLEGRFINETDLIENRKIVVISKPVKEALFKNNEALGNYIKIGSISFKVVGVLENDANIWEEIIYLPITTAQKVFHGGTSLSNICVTINGTTIEETKKMEAKIKQYFASKYHFDPEDPTAIFINNNIEDVSMTASIDSGIKIFIWIIGIMTLIAGVMGVSNIMIIMVNERKKEIGIRKALGATPLSIIRLVLSESIFITLISGFLGLVAGMGLLVVIKNILVSVAQNWKPIEYIFFNPTADVRIAISALLVLVISGVVAGYIPASKAASIKPIDALHDE